MRIIRLQAEGFKRLVAVDITPEGNLIEIRGNNGNGKSSVLDAIYSALGGAGVAPEKPVREGEEAAVIRLDLGKLIVTRYFTEEGTTGLKVTTPDGASYSSGQTMLDKLVGHISFDPLQFLDLKPSEQAEELRNLVEVVHPETGEVLDLDKLETVRKEIFDKRRDVNRDAKAVKARFDAMGGVAHVPNDAPDRDELRAKLASAAETNSAIERESNRRLGMSNSLENIEGDISALEDRLIDLKAQRDNIAKEIDGQKPIDTPIDVAALAEKLKEADRIEENKRHNKARSETRNEYVLLADRSKSLTTELENIANLRAKAIALADMPVEGLSLDIDDDGGLHVIYDGVPFSQASDAEQLRVSCAVAMAANPELRVLRVKDGSKLDKFAIEALRELAKTNDFQIWAEFVGDEGPGIIMEAGEVKGAEPPEELPKPRKRRAKDESEPGELEESVSHEAPAKEGEETLFEKMSRLSKEAQQEEPKRQPRAMTEITTKPKGQSDEQ